MTNEQMWAIYAQGIAQAAGLPTSTDGFILTGNTLVANLASTSKLLPSAPTTRDALSQVYNLGNTELPLQGIYNPTSSQFFNDYATYIDNLIPVGSQKGPNPTQSAQLKGFQIDLTNAANQLNADYNTANAAWTAQGKMFPGKYPTFQSFLNQTPWGSTISTDNAALSGVNSQISTLMTTIYGKDYVAISLAKQTVDGVRRDMQGATSTGPSDMVVTGGSGSSMVVPTYNPSSLAVFSAWVDGVITNHGNPGSQGKKITFDSSAAQYDFQKSTYFSQTNWSTDYFFFSEGGSSSSSSTNVSVDTSNSAFSLTIGFDDVTTVQLIRGPWFDSSLMGSYTNPNNLSTPTSLLIGMYPTITMTMDAASYSAAQAAYSSSSGFGFGAFWVSANGTSSSSSTLQLNAAWDSSSNSVTISSSSINPVILGMQVAEVA